MLSLGFIPKLGIRCMTAYTSPNVGIQCHSVPNFVSGIQCSVKSIGKQTLKAPFAIESQ